METFVLFLSKWGRFQNNYKSGVSRVNLARVGTTLPRQSEVVST